MRLFFICLLFYTLSPAQVWVHLPDFPDLKRDDGVAVALNGKAYFGTGLIEFASTAEFYILDLSTYSWASMTPMPANAERQYACAFTGSNCFYVFGGEGASGALNNLWKYDIATSTWLLMTPKPGNGLMGACCMNFGDKVIISGGRFQSGKVSNEVWEYTISSNSWLQKNNVPFPGRWRACATVLNNSGYLLFGRDTGFAYRKELYRYTLSSDTWTKVTDFTHSNGRNYAALHVANGKLFLFGGHDTLGAFYRDIWYYNETTNDWLQGADIPGAGRRGGMSCTYGDKFFYSCGLSTGDKRLTETWMTDIPVGIEKISRSDIFSIYPNPTNGVLYFNTSNATFRDLKYSCTDIYGRVHHDKKEMPSNFALDFNHLNQGIYFLNFYSDGFLTETKRFVKN